MLALSAFPVCLPVSQQVPVFIQPFSSRQRQENKPTQKQMSEKRTDFAALKDKTNKFAELRPQHGHIPSQTNSTEGRNQTETQKS